MPYAGAIVPGSQNSPTYYGAGHTSFLDPYNSFYRAAMDHIERSDGNSDAAEKRLSAGDVIVEVAQEAVTNAGDIKKRVDQLKKDGKKSVLLLVSNGDGELRFVALSVQ